MEMVKNGIVYDVMPNEATVLRLRWEKTPDKSINIPSSVFGKEVKRIAPHAFQNSDIVGVIIPRTIHSIGDYAFANCKRLCHVEFGKKGRFPSELSVGEKAFLNCEYLTFVMGMGHWILADSAFEGCKRMCLYGIVKEAGRHTFKGCEQLGDLHVLLGGKLDKYAFEEDSNLVVLPCGGPIIQEDISNILESIVNARATIRCFASDPVANLVYEGYKVEIVQY